MLQCLITIATLAGLFSPRSNYISNKITDMWESLSQGLITIATFAEFFSSVGLYMSKDTITTMVWLPPLCVSKWHFRWEFLQNKHVTIFAKIWFLSRMDFHVIFQIRILWKILVTEATFIYLFSSMCNDMMMFYMNIIQERLITVSALLIILCNVWYMSFQVTFQCKALLQYLHY